MKRKILILSLLILSSLVLTGVSAISGKVEVSGTVEGLRLTVFADKSVWRVGEIVTFKGSMEIEGSKLNFKGVPVRFSDLIVPYPSKIGIWSFTIALSAGSKSPLKKGLESSLLTQGTFGRSPGEYIFKVYIFDVSYEKVEELRTIRNVKDPYVMESKLRKVLFGSKDGVELIIFLEVKVRCTEGTKQLNINMPMNMPMLGLSLIGFTALIAKKIIKTSNLKPKKLPLIMIMLLFLAFLIPALPVSAEKDIKIDTGIDSSAYGLIVTTVTGGSEGWRYFEWGHWTWDASANSPYWLVCFGLAYRNGSEIWSTWGIAYPYWSDWYFRTFSPNEATSLGSFLGATAYEEDGEVGRMGASAWIYASDP